MPVRLALVVAALLAVAATKAHASHREPTAEQRAIQSYALMQRYFYVGGTYQAVYPAKGKAQLWPYSQAFAAVLALANLPHRHPEALAALRVRLRTLAEYRVHVTRGIAYAPLYGGRGNPFYDDNAWIGIDLVAAAGALRDRAYLLQAQRVLDWIETGWDTHASRCRGGVYWLMPGGAYWRRSPGSRYRAAVSTINAAQLAVELYERTGSVADLLWAERAYGWTQRCLVTSTGLIADHIDAAGAVTPDVYSYNQGADVAVAMNLYRVTRAPRYLADARQTVNAALAAFGNPLQPGDDAALLAIFYQDLQGNAADRDLRAATTSFAVDAWSTARDPDTGLFHFGHTEARLLDQAAMVQVYAEIARLERTSAAAGRARR